jgi:hypothetical protein
MNTPQATGQAGNKPEPGMLELSALDALPQSAVLDKQLSGGFKHRYTTGPFLLPENSGSLDWILLNNDSSPQKARITVYKCGIGSVKTPVAPGPLLVTLDPGKSTHNANTYTEGFVYEVQVECSSHLLFPSVSVWPGNFGVVIPGSTITAGQFLRVMP